MGISGLFLFYELHKIYQVALRVHREQMRCRCGMIPTKYVSDISEILLTFPPQRSVRRCYLVQSKNNVSDGTPGKITHRCVIDDVVYT